MFVSSAAASRPTPCSYGPYSDLVEAAHLSRKQLSAANGSRNETGGPNSRHANQAPPKLYCQESGTARPVGQFQLCSGQNLSARTLHATKPPEYQLTEYQLCRYQPEDQHPSPNAAGCRSRCLARLRLARFRLARLSLRVGMLPRIRSVGLQLRIPQIEPFVAGHAAHRPQADGRYQPIQASAAGHIQRVALAAGAGKRRR